MAEIFERFLHTDADKEGAVTKLSSKTAELKMLILLMKHTFNLSMKHTCITI